MTWLTEDPTIVIITGVLVGAALVIALMKTGRGAVLIALAATVALTTGGLLVDFLVVTPREEVDATIRAAASALETNDARGVLRHVAPEADGIRRQVAWVLDRIHIEEVVITDGPNITVIDTTAPPSAQAELIVRGRGQVKSGTTGRDLYTAKVFLTLRRDGERWMIETAEHDVPFGRP